MEQQVMKKLQHRTYTRRNHLMKGKVSSRSFLYIAWKDSMPPAICDTEVAVKMLPPSSTQGYKEFQTEASLLLSVHHQNIISLVGHCNEDVNMGIIYEYMTNWDLNKHLLGAVNLTHVAPIMLVEPEFSQKVMSTEKKKEVPLLTSEVLAHVSIMHIDETQQWYFKVCTSCDLETQIIDDLYTCTICQRIVPHPDIRYRLVVIALDTTGSLQVLLQDREIRSLIGKRARQIIPKEAEAPEGYFPYCFKLMTTKPYTMKIEITESDVVNKSGLYWATDICHGFQVGGFKVGGAANNASRRNFFTNSTVIDHKIDQLRKAVSKIFSLSQHQNNFVIVLIIGCDVINYEPSNLTIGNAFVIFSSFIFKSPATRA